MSNLVHIPLALLSYRFHLWDDRYFQNSNLSSEWVLESGMDSINTYIATIYQKIYPAMGHSSTEKKEWC